MSASDFWYSITKQYHAVSTVVGVCTWLVDYINIDRLSVVLRYPLGIRAPSVRVDTIGSTRSFVSMVLLVFATLPPPLKKLHTEHGQALVVLFSVSMTGKENYFISLILLRVSRHPLRSRAIFQSISWRSQAFRVLLRSFSLYLFVFLFFFFFLLLYHFYFHRSTGCHTMTESFQPHTPI